MDYLETSYPAPRGPRRIVQDNPIRLRKNHPVKPARYCVCGQKLSIANEGADCFRCRRGKK